MVSFTPQSRWITALRRLLASGLAVALIAASLAVVGSIAQVAPASADTAPLDGEPETVSAAALPTVQINGVVWAQVIVGNRVFATGQFSQARPAGAEPGTNETPRSNILAYDLTTGELITSWAPSLNAQGLALAASPDGSTLYVGGDFDQVNGQWRSRIAALDTQTGALRAFNPGANATVRAIAINGDTLYFGGHFTNVGTNETGFTPRTRLAAVNRITGDLVQEWAPTADRGVATMTVHPGTGRVIIGGSFERVNNIAQQGMTSLHGVTGALQPWPVNTIIRNSGEETEIASLTTDGTKVYGVGWSFVANGARANFEGVFAADAVTGNLDWVNGGRGDNYDVAVAGDVVYAVGHPHDWGMLDWNPQYPNPWQFQRALAVSKDRSPTLTNAVGTPDTWQYFPGRPASQPLHWLPTLTGGTYTGQGQAAWAIDSNGDYAVLGGEFPRVNNIPQQGLVRFAKRSIAPVVDQIQNYTELTPTLTSLGNGRVRVGWKAAWDRDNARLKVEVLRGETTATSTVLKTFTTTTTWWNRPPLGFLDTTAPPGTTQTYRIRVTDPYGNGFAGPPASITVPSGTPPATPYADTVRADTPNWQWRFGESSGNTAYDHTGSNDLALSSGKTRNVSGALLNESDTATTFPGSSSTSTVQAASPYWEGGPQRFSLEAWIRTSTTSGGKIIGFGDRRDSRSSSSGNDRNLYMANDGRIYFGVRPDMGTRVTINSPSSYRDNNWHHVVATLGDDGMRLYVDGNQVASNANVTKAQVYRGYWRVGGDNLSSWSNTPSREAIAATLDEVAVYPKALSLGRIRAHYLASGRSANFPNIPPTAAFESSTHYQTVTLDASSAFDDDGQVVGYAWSFGDGTTGSGVNTQHTYAAPGTYTVGLTVTDNRGGTNTISKPVTVVAPPPNIDPVASFTSTTVHHTGVFASTSSDEDGTIVSHQWTFGDGATGTGANPQHTYAAAGTYTVGLTVTDNRGGTHSTSGSITITDDYAADTFERTASGGLGTADNGGAWSLLGSADSFSVADGQGRITGVVGGNRSAYLAAARQTEVDLRVRASLDRDATGGGAYVSLIGRRVSNGNDYRLKLRYLAGGSVAAYLVRTVGNTETVLSSVTVPGLTVGPDQQIRARFQITGTNPTTVRAKVWRAGTQEGTSWLLSSTDTTPAVLQAPGDIGVLLYVSGSWTGPAPVLSIDNLVANAEFGPPVNQLPVAIFHAAPEYLTAWLDASSSFDPDDGQIVGYAWDFGDGTTGSGITAQHVYSTAGTYLVTLTVTDNGGATATTSELVSVNDPPPPTAHFEWTSQFLRTQFDASGSADVDGTIVAYDWNFGDGSTGTGATPEHTYSAGGTYVVTLNVTDDKGNTGSVSHDITVEPQPDNVQPVADFTSSVSFRTASFTSTSHDPDGEIVGYAWDFGDGTTGSGATPQHTYAAGGTYTVTLTVTDDRGGTDTATGQVSISAGYALDSFERTVANGFGTADVGGAWTTSGSASSYAVSGGTGRITGAVGGNRAVYLGSVNVADIDVVTNVALDRDASGGGAYVSLIGRRVSNGNDYRLKLRYLAGGSVAAYLVRTVGNTETVLSSVTVPGLSVGADDQVRARFQVTGTSPTTLRAKVWRAGTPQPQGWLLTANDATPAVLQAPGELGVLVYVSGSWTGAAPVVSLDDLAAAADLGEAVNLPPQAAFDASVQLLEAEVDASASHDPDGTIASYDWDFGDGGAATGVTAQHTYTEGGTYTITLTVTDDAGSTAIATQSVTVAEVAPPVAAFVATPNQLTVDVDGSDSNDSDGTIEAYEWDFGDGGAATGVTAQHTYTEGGTYTVTLTVTDDSGLSSSVSHDVTVVAPAPEFARDAFERNVSDGFGTAEVGGPWTLSGAASSFAVSGGAGRITGAVGGNRSAYLADVRQRDVDITTDLALDVPATGGGVYASIIGRRVSNNNDYRLKLRYLAGGSVAAYVVRTLGGVETVLGSVTLGLTVSPGDVLRARLEISGTTTTTVRAKVWRAGVDEPEAWTLSGTDATPALLQADGDLGILVYTSGSWTGGAPTIAVDNLRVAGIQPA